MGRKVPRTSVTLYASRLNTPMGPLGLAVRDEGVAWVGQLESPTLRPRDPGWPESAVDPSGRLGVRIWVWEEEPRMTGPLADALTRYFAGDKDAMRGLPVAPSGTPFQMAVWEACARIGFAETATYGELAAEVGRPAAARAVGQAMQRNPVPPVVPCHRVVGSDEALVGYSMGGVHVKRWLLEHERRILARTAQTA